jgi:hypothetical protein
MTQVFDIASITFSVWIKTLENIEICYSHIVLHTIPKWLLNYKLHILYYVLVVRNNEPD